MKVNFKVLTMGLVLGMFLLSACGSRNPQGVSATAVLETVTAVVDPTQAAMGDIQTKAVAMVGIKLASQLSVDVSTLKLVSVEPMEWTDSCLGLGQANESCLQTITPGYRVTFSSGGQNYVFRVDQAASTVRQEP